MLMMLMMMSVTRNQNEEKLRSAARRQVRELKDALVIEGYELSFTTRLLAKVLIVALYLLVASVSIAILAILAEKLGTAAVLSVVSSLLIVPAIYRIFTEIDSLGK